MSPISNISGILNNRNSDSLTSSEAITIYNKVNKVDFEGGPWAIKVKKMEK